LPLLTGKLIRKVSVYHTLFDKGYAVITKYSLVPNGLTTYKYY